MQLLSLTALWFNKQYKHNKRTNGVNNDEKERG